MTQRQWATKEDVAEHLHVSVRTVQRMVDDGQIRAYKCGPRLTRFDINEIDAMLGSRIPLDLSIDGSGLAPEITEEIRTAMEPLLTALRSDLDAIERCLAATGQETGE